MSNSKIVMPKWLFVRSRIAILEPFPSNSCLLPPLNSKSWLGRIVWEYNSDCVIDSSIKTTNAWICSNSEYDYKCLHVKARNQTKKAEKEGARFYKSDWQKLSIVIPSLVSSTFHRQGRSSESNFLKYLSSLKAIDSLEWGGAVDLWVVERQGVIGALIIGLMHKDVYHILHQLSDADSLWWCPNNFLTYSVTNYALTKLNCRHVNYGVDGLDRSKLIGLDVFKSRMGYTLKPCREHFVGNPIFTHIIRVISSVLTCLSNFIPAILKVEAFRILIHLGGRV